MMPQWDWMQVTIAEFPRVITDALMSELPGASSLSHGRGRHNYRHSAIIADSHGDVLATVLHGGSNPAPNAVATGDAAPAFTDVVRRHWPDHAVTRCDTAADVRTDYAATVAALREVGASFGIKGYAHVPDDPEDGGTYYMGATSSSVRLRCYEKGKQLRSQLVDPEAAPLDWVRLEQQFRPVRQGRQVAASLSPSEAWGVSRWTQHTARELIGVSTDRVQVTARTRTTRERRLRAMSVQWGSTLREIAATEGSWEAAGLFLRDLCGAGPDDA